MEGVIGERKENERERVVISSTCSFDKDPPILCLYFTHAAVPIMVVWTLGPSERVKEWEAERQLLCVCMRVCLCVRARPSVAVPIMKQAGCWVTDMVKYRPPVSLLSLLLSFAFSDSHTLRCPCFSTL